MQYYRSRHTKKNKINNKRSQVIKMRSTAPMKVAKIGYIAISVLSLVLGVVLIAKPDISMKTVGTVLGVIMIAFGIVKLVGYFSKDLFRLAFEYDLAAGILMILIGTVLVSNPARALEFFCTVLGILVLADGLFKIQISIDSKRFGIRLWWLILATAIITGALGVALIFAPEESVRLMTVLLGVTLLCDGILNISTMLTAVKIVNNQRPERDVYYDDDDREGK